VLPMRSPSDLPARRGATPRTLRPQVVEANQHLNYDRIPCPSSISVLFPKNIASLILLIENITP